jgi:predicted polyphosphate/ATP-dependent NAD kinase
LNKTLLGGEAVLDGNIEASDASEAGLMRLSSMDCPAEIVVTPIGGQDGIFGRGIKPISPEVIRKVGRAHIRVACTPEKNQALKGVP